MLDAEKIAAVRGEMPCVWCGQSFGKHLDSRPKNAPVPRMPCLGLKSGYHSKPVDQVEDA
jgi:hypothetical protein